MADMNDHDRGRRRKRRGSRKVYFHCLSLIIAQSLLHVKTTRVGSVMVKYDSYRVAMTSRAHCLTWYSTFS